MTTTPTTAIRSGITAVLAAALAVAVLPGIAHADETRDKQWALESLDITEAHKETRGAGVTIGMVDSGVDAEHPDLKGNIKPGLSTFDESKGLKDTLGHGTAMASNLVAHGHGTNNSKGALGIAPEAEVLTVSIYPPSFAHDPYGGDNIRAVHDGMVKGIEWLADQDVDVILVASGGIGTPPDLEDAVTYAVKTNDIPVVAPVGNQEKIFDDVDTAVNSPASMDCAIAVNGTTENDKLWDGAVAPTSRVDGLVTVSAPAEYITTAKNGGGYETKSGTSDASAITAGVVALMKAQWPFMGWKDIEWRLAKSADDVGKKGFDYTMGHGLINPVEALTAHVDPPDGIDDELINPPVNPEMSSAPNKDASKQVTELTAVTGTNTWLIIAITSAAILAVGAVIVTVLVRKRNKTPTPPAFP